LCCLTIQEDSCGIGLLSSLWLDFNSAVLIVKRHAWKMDTTRAESDWYLKRLPPTLRQNRFLSDCYGNPKSNAKKETLTAFIL